MTEETTTTMTPEEREKEARDRADALTDTQEAVRIAIAAEESPDYREYLRNVVAPFVAAEAAAAQDMHARARREALDPVEAHNAGVAVHEYVLDDLTRSRGLSGIEELREKLKATGHANTAKNLLKELRTGSSGHVTEVLDLEEREKRRLPRAFGATLLSPRS